MAVAMLDKMDTLVPILKNLGKKVKMRRSKQVPLYTLFCLSRACVHSLG